MKTGTSNRDWCGCSDMSYADYLKSRQLEQSIRYDIQEQSAAIIASNKQLASQQLCVLQSTETAVRDGFVTVSENISSLEGLVKEGFAHLTAIFEWGFSEMLISLGHVNDSLNQLIKIAKTPAQSWAYEQFEIARDELRRGLYEEALESVQRAIHGFGSNAGYKSEFRFHFLLGTIFLGSYRNTSLNIVNPSIAEKSFLDAARYAIHDYPTEAAMAYLLSGRAAYVQRKNKDACDYTKLALKCNDGLGEAHFQMAKILCAEGEHREAMTHLKRAVSLDRMFAVRAGGEGEFRPYLDLVNQVLDELRFEARQHYDVAASQFDVLLHKLSSLDIRHLTMSSLGKDELAKVIQYRDKFLEIAQTNTLFGYLDATFLSSNTDVCKEAVEEFKKKATNEVLKNKEAIAGQIRSAESDKNKAPRYGMVWGLCLIGFALLGVISSLADSKHHIIDRIIMSIFTGIGGIIVGAGVAFVIILLIGAHKGAKNLSIGVKLNKLNRDKSDADAFLQDINKLTIQ